MQRVTGIGVSPGVVAGRAVVLVERMHTLRYQISPGRVPQEIDRLERGRQRSREQLLDIRAQLGQRRGPELAALFDAQLLMLDDPMIVPKAAELIRANRVNAEWAVEEVLRGFGALFEEVADPYLRERTGDVADLIGRLRMNLRHLSQGAATPRDLLRDIEEASILIADELTPSVAAQVDWTKIRGFAADAGSRTYHTAILARSLDVPAVVGLHNASLLVQPGQFVAIDADNNELILEPDERVLARVRQGEADRRPAIGDAERKQPAQTADAVRIRLEANIEFPDDLAGARYAGAEGIGLYRSEFLSSGGSNAEEAQYEVYRRMLEDMAPGPVTIRTFDTKEHGLQGLRLSLARPDVFRTQVRALLRAARHGSLRIMFPFVSNVGEVREARQIVADVAGELSRAGQRVPDVPIGVMIEIPAAAYSADLLAREADFLTIGTNDLIQDRLAVDRADERVSNLYEPLHPGVLRLIVMVRRAAARRGIPVSLCGEMAADPMLLALLVGLGLTEFSMTPGAIAMAKRLLSDVRRDELKPLARRILRLATAEEIERELAAALNYPATRLSNDPILEAGRNADSAKG